MGRRPRHGRLAAAAAIGVVAKVAYDLGAQFDGAYDDTLRIKTGSTGAALDDLRTTSAPSSRPSPPTSPPSQAIAGLNSRLGLTGPPLQQLSRQMLELSRITETDLGSNVETLTRLFGDWSISADQQSATMDKLFLASQKTGVGFDQVASTVTQHGTTLRASASTSTESVTLLSKWGKEGVNTEAVLGAMKKAFGSFLRRVRRPAAQFRGLHRRDFPKRPPAAAAGIAIDKLGVRNGSRLAARRSVRTVRLRGPPGADLGRLGHDPRSSGRHLRLRGEVGEIFRNKVMLKLEPVPHARLRPRRPVHELGGSRGIPSWKSGRQDPHPASTGARQAPSNAFWREHGDTVIDVLTKIGQALWVAFQVQTKIWAPSSPRSVA